MLNREQKERSQSEIICIDDLVPKNHLLRKIDETVDFTKIYYIVGKLYSANQGRPSTEPVFTVSHRCEEPPRKFA